MTHEQRVFQDAMEIKDPIARDQFLSERCKNDPQLFERVSALLRQVEHLTYAPSDGFLPPNQVDRNPIGGVDHPDLSFLTHSDQPSVLGRLGKYDILEVIGTGGFGIVLGAYDNRLARDVAIKVLSPQLAKTSPPRKRFLREARAVASISHPNVVQIFEVEDTPIPYIVMEKIPGGTLRDFVDNQGPLEIGLLLELTIQLCDALSRAHQSGVIHRDVKPENVLLDTRKAPRAVLSDFGLARTIDDASLTQSGGINGTPMYMSPEQARGLKVDARSDQFSLGCVLYSMATGRAPFRAGNALAVMQRVIHSEERAIQDIIPNLPDWYCQVVKRMMSKNPSERFSDLEELTIELRKTQSFWQANGSFPLFGLNTTPTIKQRESGLDPIQTIKDQDANTDQQLLKRDPKNNRVTSWMRFVLVRSVVLLFLMSLAYLYMAFFIYPHRFPTQGENRWAWMSEVVLFHFLPQLRPPQVDAPARFPPLYPDEVQELKALSTEIQTKYFSDQAPALAVVPFDSAEAGSHQERWAIYLDVPVRFTDPNGIDFSLIPPGLFKMGTDTQQADGIARLLQGVNVWSELVHAETPRHTVLISQPFYLASTEITQLHYDSVMTGQAEKNSRDLPITGVSWEDAMDFCKRLNLRYGLSEDRSLALKNGDEGLVGSYGLPTEAQWEFACRAGTSTWYWFGNHLNTESNPENLSDTPKTTLPVASGRSNPFGLYDMHGNIAELVFDVYEAEIYKQRANSQVAYVSNPSGPKVLGQSLHTIRGGDFNHPSLLGRSATRRTKDSVIIGGNGVGFRVRLSVDGAKRLLPKS